MNKKEIKKFEEKYQVKVIDCVYSTHPVYGRMKAYIIDDGAFYKGIMEDNFSSYRAYFAYAYVENVDHPNLSEWGEVGLAYDKHFNKYTRIW